jgi:hypothetical protein
LSALVGRGCVSSQSARAVLVESTPAFFHHAVSRAQQTVQQKQIVNRCVDVVDDSHGRPMENNFGTREGLFAIEANYSRR